jgi:hypothetical protein
MTLKNSLIGEEWMALRQVAFVLKAAEMPQSVETKLLVLGLIAKDLWPSDADGDWAQNDRSTRLASLIRR